MNNYDVPEIIEIGTAHTLILDLKQPEETADSFQVPFSTETVRIDDFDE